MSLYKRKGSPFWQSEIEVRLHRFNRSTGTTSRREAEAWERRFREDKRKELERAPNTAVLSDITVDQMFGKYWEKHGKDLRWSANVAAYAKRIVGIIGHLKVAHLNLVDCVGLFETLKDEGMGKVSRNRALSVLRAAHRMAGTRWGCPVQLIDWKELRIKEPKERVKWATREEAYALVTNSPDHIALIVEWSLYTGLRKRETVGLLKSAVNLARNSVTVTVKGGEARTFEMSDAARDVLERALEANPKSLRVFDATNLRKHFVKACKVAGLKDFHFHDLRHTFATWLRQGGAPLEVVSRACGHSSVHVTQKYAHVDDREVLAATGGIGLLRAPNVVQLAGVGRNDKPRHAGKNAGM